MRKDKVVEIYGGKCVSGDVSTAAAAIIKATHFPPEISPTLSFLNQVYLSLWETLNIE